MRFLVCDNDESFGRRLAGMIGVYFEARDVLLQCAVCTSGEQVLARDDLELLQVVFLDVDMSPVDGISLGKELKRRNPAVLLVYVSAYLEFALKGYTVSAFRYLLKKDVEQTLPVCLEEILTALSDSDKSLVIRVNRETFNIPIRYIYYLESDLRKINVYGDIPHVPIKTYYGKLADLPGFLYDNGFLKVGRSYVVNMQYIRHISGYKLRLRNGVELSVSRSGYAKIRDAFLEWKGQFANG